MGALKKFLGVLSGGKGLKVSEQLLYDKVVGVKGIVPGVGTSTVVQNLAIALTENTNCTVCVVDMNCLYPTQYHLLVKSEDDKPIKGKKDIFEYSGEISEMVVPTEYRGVYLIGYHNRGVVDMMGAKDNAQTLNSFIDNLKSYFDIILLDLSYELTVMNTYASIKCNKIIQVADQSLKCVINSQKAVNTMGTLGIPFAKANKVFLNKIAPDLVTDTGGLFKEMGFEILAEAHFSLDILKAGVSGKRVYYNSKTNEGYQEFNEGIEKLVDYIMGVNPLVEKYKGKEQERNDYEEEEEEIVF